MKKFLSVILVLCLLVSLSSCSTSFNTSEIKMRTIIQGLGLDLGENGELELSVQTLNTDVSSHASSNSTPDSLVKYYNVSGKTLSEAVDSLASVTGKTPILSQNRIVVIGNRLAKTDFMKYLDDFVRNTDNRFTVLVCVSENDAKEIIEADLGENVIPARLIEQIIETSCNNLNIVNTKVYELVEQQLRFDISSVVPILKLNEKEKQNEISADSAAVIRNRKFYTEIEKENIPAVRIINDCVESGEITVDFDNMPIVLNVLNLKCTKNVNLKNGVPNFNIKINCSFDIAEISDSIYSKKTASDIEKINSLAENSIKTSIENTLKKCIMSEEDLFGLTRMLWRTQPDFFRQHENEIPNILKSSIYNVDVSSSVKRVGDSAAELYSK